MTTISTGFLLPIGDGLSTEAYDGDGYYVFPGQNFGDLVTFSSGSSSYHLGEDWNAEGRDDYGESVYSISNGIVIAVIGDQGASTTGFGNYVLIRHDLPATEMINGHAVTSVYSLYAHLSSTAVTVGQEVTANTVIGAIGASGYAQGAHLHLEMTLAPVQPTSDDGYNPNGPPSYWIDPTDFINSHRSFEPPPISNARSDFNGDGTSDILWYNTVTRAVGQYEMHNSVATWKPIGSGAANWQVVTAGDFNGDGADDILWFNTATRAVGDFEMHGGQATWKPIASSGAVNWQALDAGDFNGDGTDDVLWYNTVTRAVGAYEMHSGQPTWVAIGAGAANWKVVDTGDFNGDGTDDILWYNTVSRAVGEYEMHNGAATWKAIGTGAANWQAVAAGDFNGDSTDDILWFNTATRALGDFEMHGGQATWKPIASAGAANWQAVDAGDYNGDGTDDVLWQNTVSHAVGDYEMHNGQPTWVAIGTGSANWTIIA